jgi:pSer/pThr/pTyr-binding forkhead associated (FHA) protein
VGPKNLDKGSSAGPRELEVPLTKPIRLGRIDPREGVYPDVDLTADLAMEHGVSREHACIFQRGNVVEVEDLASTNGTLLNGTRLAPYLPVSLKNGDRLHLGKLLIEVRMEAKQRRTTTTQTRLAVATAH